MEKMLLLKMLRRLVREEKKKDSSQSLPKIQPSTSMEELSMPEPLDTPLFPPPPPRPTTPLPTPVDSMTSLKISEEKPSEELSTTSTNAAASVTSTCKRCFKVFNRFAFYLKHIRSNECSVLYNGHWCSFCKRYFQNKKACESHEKKHRLAIARKQQGTGANRFERIDDLHGCKVYRAKLEC